MMFNYFKFVLICSYLRAHAAHHARSEATDQGRRS